MSERYFIDERVGCIAVRDRNDTDPDYQGLHPDTDGVIQFWGAEQRTSKCPTCNHGRFGGRMVRDCDRIAARRLVAELNAKAKGE